MLFWYVDAEGADCSLFPNLTGHGGFLSVDRGSIYVNPTCEVYISLWDNCPRNSWIKLEK
jgi:hypothetical protein